jgi:hypothetical protein
MFSAIACGGVFGRFNSTNQPSFQTKSETPRRKSIDSTKRETRTPKRARLSFFQMCELGRLKTRDRLRSPVVAFAFAATVAIAVAITATEVATASAAAEVATATAAATEAATATAAAATEAATATAAATEAAATTAAAAAEAATRWTRSAWLRFIHNESATFEVLAVERFDRCGACFLRAHSHEAEATRTASFTVRSNEHVEHFAMR